MDPDFEMEHQTPAAPQPEPSLRSEFGSGSALPEGGVLRFGPVGASAPPAGPARTYSFTKNSEQTQPAAPEAAPSAAPNESFLPRPQAADPAPVSAQPAQPVYAAPQVPAQPAGSIPVPNTAGPAVPFRQAPAPAQPRPETREKEGAPWLWVAVAAALVLGLLVGAFGYRLLADHRESAPSTAETDTRASSGDRTEAGGIYDANAASVVSIFVADGSAAAGSEMTNAGTGFALTADGYILTNYHVVKDAAAVVVTLLDGRQLPARLVATENAASDLALLKVEAADLHPVELGDSDSLRVGDWICTIGNPFGELDHSLTVGYISAKERPVTTDGATVSMLQINASLNAGNSGGPLFDASGRVVGVVTAKYSGGTPSGAAVEGLGFAIPIQEAKSLIETWIQADRP